MHFLKIQNVFSCPLVYIFINILAFQGLIKMYFQFEKYVSFNCAVYQIRFTNRKAKTELLRQGRKLRGSDVYLNEHLTKKNADIARQARILKKQNKIQATWTRNCKVWIKLNGSPEEASIIVVRELSELDRYK